MHEERLLIITFLLLLGWMIFCSSNNAGKGPNQKEREKVICIISVGEIEQSILLDLKPKLKEVFGLEVEIEEGLDKPDYAYNPERKQYFSTRILKEITKTPYKECEKVLGVVDLDLYVPSLNFVFGEADIWGKACIISVSRLRQSFYALPEDPELFQKRVLKEAVHELGHTFGLSHCPDIKCVMHFSNSLQDTDKKSNNFCERCKRLVGE